MARQCTVTHLAPPCRLYLYTVMVKSVAEGREVSVSRGAGEDTFRTTAPEWRLRTSNWCPTLPLELS